MDSQGSKGSRVLPATLERLEALEHLELMDNLVHKELLEPRGLMET